MLVRLRLAPAVALFAAGLSLVACGGSTGSVDDESRGARARAVGLLEDAGLDRAQAGCLVDELGAATVNESPSMDVLAAGAEYQDAARTCRP